MHQSLATLFALFVFVGAQSAAPQAQELGQAVIDLSMALAEEDEAKVRASADYILESSAEALGLAPGEYGRILYDMAKTFLARDDLDRAQAFAEKVVQLRAPKDGTATPDSIAALDLLADVFHARGHVQDEIATRRKALDAAYTLHGEGDTDARWQVKALAEALPDADEGEKAELIRTFQKLDRDADDKASRISIQSGAATGDVNCPEGSEKTKSEIIPVHYATHRAPTGDDTPADFFGTDLSERAAGEAQMHYGIVPVSVPCKRIIGDVPWRRITNFDEDDPIQFVIMKKPQVLANANKFYSSVSKTLNRTDEKVALVYIHGYANTFEDAARRTGQIAADLELKGAPIMYSWPSLGSKVWYFNDRNMAKSPAVIEDVARFLKDIVERTTANRIHLVAHSMGNEVLMEALKLLSISGSIKVEKPFDEIVFASPDVKVSDFANLVKHADKLGRNMTLYSSSEDWALFFSKYLQAFQRAGDASDPFTRAGLDTIDTSKVSAGWIGHDDFSFNAIDDFRSLVWFGLNPTQRCLLSARHKDNGDPFWELAGTPDALCGDPLMERAMVVVYRRGFEDAKRLYETAIANPDEAPNLEKLKGILKNIHRLESQI